jgi:hypothetical protein
MKDTSKPARGVGEVWTRREGAQTAIFDPSSQKLIRLNPSALAIWELCDGETDRDEIVAALVELTGRSDAEILNEVDETLDRLRKVGLIV